MKKIDNDNLISVQPSLKSIKLREKMKNRK